MTGDRTATKRPSFTPAIRPPQSAAPTLAKNAGVSGGDLLRLLAYHAGVERPVKRYPNQPYRSRGCEKPTYVHNPALSSSAGGGYSGLDCPNGVRSGTGARRLRGCCATERVESALRRGESD